MKIVFLVPYRSDIGGRRDDLWSFVSTWLEKHHWDWDVYTGASPPGPFNRGAAINNAARKAGDWDVAIVHDIDNISDPTTLRKAVKRSYESGRCVFPFSTYLYLDQYSSDRLMSEDNWFVAPERRSDGSFPYMIIERHRSGVQVISRSAWDKIGGYVELTGWGYEDSATEILLKVFVGPVEHLEGTAYHLYHESLTSSADGKNMWGPINRNILGDIMSLQMLPDQLRAYLQEGGHKIPNDQHNSI